MKRPEPDNDHDLERSGSINSLDEHYSHITPRSYQFRALMRKNFKLQMRQRCTLCCQIAVPLILILFVGAMQLVFNSLVKDQQKGYNYPGLDYLQNLDGPTAFFMGANPTNSSELGYINYDGTKAGFLGGIEQRRHNISNIPYYTPFMTIYNSRSKMMSELKNVKEKWNAEFQSGKKSDDIPFPSLALTFMELILDPSKAYTFTLEVLKETQFPYTLFFDDNRAEPYLISGIAMFANLFIQKVSTNKSVDIFLRERGFPYEEAPLNIDIGSLLAALTYPLIMSWLLPVYVYNIVLEKQDKLREMMKMMGLKMRNYWLVNYLYFAVLYLSVLVIVYGLSYAFQFYIFTQGSIIATIALFLLWGHAQICLSFFFSAIFGKTRTATIFCYFLVIIQVIVSYVVNATVFKQDEPPFFWLLWPPFAFYRAIFILGVVCGLGDCPTTSDYDWSNQITHIWVYLFFTSAAVLVLAFYLDAILPKEFGIARKPWFFLTPIYRMIRNGFSKKGGCCGNGNEEEVSLLVKSVPGETELDEELDEAEDVAAERDKVYRGLLPADTPIWIKDLKKEYGARFGKGKHLALRNLTIGIPKGECFGLLGPNGAGKTTTISILTGLFPPTSGSARVGGFDISTDIDLVHRVMGVCPQFDTLWMDLTCEETLLFYARLKGVDAKDEAAHVKESLTQVGLQDTPHRLVSDLSGGMRRRLSVAVSICGNPRIVFLDEPTTGLDPESRRQLWDVLTQVKVGRCIILTTHSMEEADVLCTTIGIMSKGALRCVGPQQLLKQRFGQGYTLTINFDVDDSDKVDKFIRTMLPTATLVEDFVGNRTYQIPTKDVIISELFTTMQSHQEEAGITDWGINQTSLEDVFLHICRDDEGTMQA